MTLSIMENHDVFKSALKDYQNSMGDIPKILERYLEYVARTGKPLFSWEIISCVIIKKFDIVIKEYSMEKIIPSIRSISTDPSIIEELKSECFKVLNNFNGVPFTIQRICELLLNPRQYYSKMEKFLRGFLRVIKVVTTVDRVGQKITTESQFFANSLSPFPINESGDVWSGLSSQSDDSGSNIQSSSPASEPNSIVEQEQPVQTTSVYPTADQFFIEQKTISMPPIGALFKPIDQLEAFVQNVSSQVESTTGSSNSSVVGKQQPDESTRKRLVMDEDSDDDKTMLSSTMDSDYSSQAKRLKCDDDASASSNEAMKAEGNPDESVVLIDDEEVLPSRSSAISVCAAEEASSTNNGHGSGNDDGEDRQGRDGLDDREDNNVVMSSSDRIDDDSCDGDDEKLGNGVNGVDVGHSDNQQTVEADQSNCSETDSVNDGDNGSLADGGTSSSTSSTEEVLVVVRSSSLSSEGTVDGGDIE